MLETTLQAVGIPTAIAAIVLLSALLVGPLRRRPGLADAALAVCLPCSAFITFMFEKGLPTLPPEQKWLIVPWVLLCAAALGVAARALAPRGNGSMQCLLAAAAAGGLGGWPLVLPGLDSLDASVTLGLQLGLGVLLLGAVARSGRPVTCMIGAWACAALLSLTLLISANITMGLAAGAVSATAAVGAVGLSLFRGSAPAGRVGVGTAASLAVTLVIFLVVGQAYDYSMDGIAAWRWWLCLMPLALLVLLPGGKRSSLALTAVLVPTVVALAVAWPQLQDLMATGGSVGA